MTTKITRLASYFITWDDGTTTNHTVTPTEWAAIKRSKKWKKALSVKKIATITSTIKIY